MLNTLTQVFHVHCENLAVRFTAAAFFVESRLTMSWRTRTDSTTLIRHTNDDLTASTESRKVEQAQVTDANLQQSCGDTEKPELRELQSGERASTIPTTQNTCSSPGNPVTTDLSHFSAL